MENITLQRLTWVRSLAFFDWNREGSAGGGTSVLGLAGLASARVCPVQFRYVATLVGWIEGRSNLPDLGLDFAVFFAILSALSPLEGDPLNSLVR
jgi:hypothetical protein